MHVAGVCDTPLRILVKLLLNLMPTIILCRVSTALDHRENDLGPSSQPRRVSAISASLDNRRIQSWFKLSNALCLNYQQHDSA